MKKIISLLLIQIIAITSFPINALALQQNVGINVKGDISISAITTISSDITIDVENKTTNAAHIELKNNSFVPLNVKVTDIESLTIGAPSTFVSSGQCLAYAGVEDTKNKIGFSIGQGDMLSDILPDTEIQLGVVGTKLLGSGSFEEEGLTLDSNETIQYKPFDPYMDPYSWDQNQYTRESYEDGAQIYELIVNNGFAWTESDLNFYYAITMVVGAYESEGSEPQGIGIRAALLDNTDIYTRYNYSYIEVFVEGDQSEVEAYNLAVQTASGEGKDYYMPTTEYIGSIDRVEKVWDDATSSLVEVENGKVFGRSYFYKVSIDNNPISLSNATSPWYFKVSFTLWKNDGTTANYGDILTNMYINK